MPGKLESDTALRAQLDAALAANIASKGAMDWVEELAKFFDEGSHWVGRLHQQAATPNGVSLGTNGRGDV